MRFIAPSHEILTKIDSKAILKSLERAGRTAYKSENLIKEGSAEKFVRKIVHEFKHESVIEHESISVRIVCDRGVSHEIVRHRLASYTQESTRYCNYSKDKFGKNITFILPCWLNADDMLRIFQATDDKKPMQYETTEWLLAMSEAERHYFTLLEKGWNPQQARSVLPNSLKTEITMTANLREWRHFFKLRTHKAAHPQMREIAIPLLKEMQAQVPVIFEDLEPKQ